MYAPLLREATVYCILGLFLYNVCSIDLIAPELKLKL